MTIKELHDATAALGFEETLESSLVFFAAANRALYCANRIRPKTRELEVKISDADTDKSYKSIGGSRYVIVNASEADESFLCYAPIPVLSGTKRLYEGKDYIIYDEKTILLPCETQGDFRIRYYKKPRRMTNDDEGAQIDLDEDICQILPLLVASYVWLEDEKEKAQTYKSLFYSEASALKEMDKKSRYAPYDCEAGWSC